MAWHRRFITGRKYWTYNAFHGVTPVMQYAETYLHRLRRARVCHSRQRAYAMCVVVARDAAKRTRDYFEAADSPDAWLYRYGITVERDRILRELQVEAKLASVGQLRERAYY
jgi:hypothetical protein